MRIVTAVLILGKLTQMIELVSLVDENFNCEGWLK